MKVNFEFKYNNPLEINMLWTISPNRFRTRLFPRGTAEVKREFREAGDNYGGYYIKEKVIYNLNYIIPEQRAFCIPVNNIWAKENLLALSIAESVQRELNAQKKPGGILNKYGVL